jgi:hypothetical protein
MIDVGDVEQFDHLVDAEYFLVAMRPAEPNQVIQQSLAKITLVPVFAYVYRTVTLRQLCAVGAEDHGQMCKLRRRRTQCVVHIYLSRRIVEVIVASNHVGNTHIGIIDDDREIVRRRPVRTGYYEIVELGVLEHHSSPHQVIDDDLAIQGIPEPDDGRYALPRRSTITATAVVSDALSTGHLFGAQGIEFLPGTEAVVGFSRLQPFINDRTISIETAGLKYRFLIGIEPQPGQTIENSLDILRRRSFAISIFYPDEESASGVPGIQPAKQGGANTSEVQYASGAGSESGCDGHSGAALVKREV